MEMFLGGIKMFSNHGIKKVGSLSIHQLEQGEIKTRCCNGNINFFFYNVCIVKSVAENPLCLSSKQKGFSTILSSIYAFIASHIIFRLL